MTQSDQPAKDQRRWAKFPIDMHRDPKISRLETDVKWTFVEMNLDARAESNDGVFEQEDAEFRWSLAHLDALVGSHPTAPLIERGEGGSYVIRRYAAYQLTNAEIAAARAKKSTAGKAGAAARWGVRPEVVADAAMAPAMAPAMAAFGDASLESESDLEREFSNTDLSGQEGERGGAGDKTDLKIPAILVDLKHFVNIEATEAEARQWAEFVLAHSAGVVRDRQAYVLTSMYNNCSEVEAWFDRHRGNGMGLAA